MLHHSNYNSPYNQLDKMPLVNFSNLDFDEVKTSLKDYLRSNSDFTDYDFEGSNLSTILDVLAYNTYITSYNANMVANEVFIDTATLRENVIALARNIGYTPRSRKAATSALPAGPERLWPDTARGSENLVKYNKNINICVANQPREAPAGYGQRLQKPRKTR